MPRGGKRKGAGRKPSPDPNKARLSVTIDSSLKAQLELSYDLWQTTNPDSSMSQFVEQILKTAEWPE